MDGHDVKAVVSALRNLRKLHGPQFLHVVTRKGKGYAPAEADPIKWHGPGPFDPVSGTIFKEKSTGPSYSQIFGQWACDMAAREPHLIVITPAMREGSGLVEFSKRFPDRYFDVAIAEQHSVTFAAGLAVEGLKPIVAIYSTFLQRASLYRVCRSCSPSTARASSAATAPRIREVTISPICAAFPTWSSWPRLTRMSAARCCIRRAR
jgi:1-deoxy-D-xylulose-5-phosphate synthase